MLLLQERIPKATAFYSHTAQLSDLRTTFGDAEMPVRRFSSPHTPIPEVQLLSNGRYHVMITNAGGGYSRWKDLAVTRWREDSTRDNWGMFCYIRDVASGEFWSTAYQPTLQPPQNYEVIFSEGRAEFRRRDHEIETYSEIVVSPEDDIELRRTRITNGSGISRTIEITSYAEIVLASSAADALHPAFSNLFVQTEIIRERQAILCTRRPRSLDEQSPWMCHLMTVHGADIGTMSYETDRVQFIGRGCTAATTPALAQATSPGASAARARCSIRLSPSGVGSRSIRKNRPRLIWCPASATLATSAWGWSRNTTIGVSPIVFSIWRGPIARWSCGS
jgi:cellobiose phosphorylase